VAFYVGEAEIRIYVYTYLMILMIKKTMRDVICKRIKISYRMRNILHQNNGRIWEILIGGIVLTPRTFPRNMYFSWTPKVA